MIEFGDKARFGLIVVSCPFLTIGSRKERKGAAIEVGARLARAGPISSGARAPIRSGLLGRPTERCEGGLAAAAAARRSVRPPVQAAADR